jgi:hypothetical protein
LPAVHGGSGYFDGTADYLVMTTASSSVIPATNTTPFTIECWVYNTGTSGTVLYAVLAAENYAFSIGFGGSVGTYDATATPWFGFYSGAWYGIRSSTLIPINAWTHLACVFTGSTNYIYQDGIMRASGGPTTWGVINSASKIRVGCRSDAINTFTGYISNARITIGSNLYPNGSNFAPPTVPFTPVANTSLLLNLTNAGVTDATAKNVLETVNSASLSNAVAKWGNTSLKFASATSDYLWTNNQAAQVQIFGTGDFTIDGWVYLTTINTAFGIISKGTANTGWSVNITSNNKLQFSYTATALTGATSLVQGTWYYFAVVRSGSAAGNLKLYLAPSGAISSADATSAGAVTDNFNQTSALYVGADRAGSSFLNGYLQDIRMTSYARAITAAPTTAFPLL